MSNRSKHRILKQLLKTYNDKSYTGSNYTEAGRTLSTEDIHRKTNIKLDDLTTILGALQYYDYIKKYHLVDKTSDFWGITDKGKDAISTKRFLWYSNHQIWFNVITLIIALVSLFISLFKN